MFNFNPLGAFQSFKVVDDLNKEGESKENKSVAINKEKEASSTVLRLDRESNTLVNTFGEEILSYERANDLKNHFQKKNNRDITDNELNNLQIKESGGRKKITLNGSDDLFDIDID
ncbi:MAG: hypothetical protein NTY12_02365 [Candidatus Falkowbacteria bacterium]|nr:hypothetical protein [Candidatus Falkowbacteria bacterium]